MQSSENNFSNTFKKIARAASVVVTAGSLGVAVESVTNPTENQANRNAIVSSDRSVGEINRLATDDVLAHFQKDVEITPEMINKLKDNFNGNFDKLREAGRILRKEFPQTYSEDKFKQYISALFQIAEDFETSSQSQDYVSTLSSIKDNLDQVQGTLIVGSDMLNEKAAMDDEYKEKKALVAIMVTMIGTLIGLFTVLLDSQKTAHS